MNKVRFQCLNCGNHFIEICEDDCKIIRIDVRYHCIDIEKGKTKYTISCPACKCEGMLNRIQ